jgi:hypothetical protein
MANGLRQWPAFLKDFEEWWPPLRKITVGIIAAGLPSRRYSIQPANFFAVTP